MFELSKIIKEKLTNPQGFDPKIKDLLFFSNSIHPISAGTSSIVVNISTGNIKELENDPSIIWTTMDIKRPEINECVDTNVGYFPSYYSLDEKQKYLYLQWLTNIKEPAGKSFLLILLYCLERNIVMGNYREAIEVIEYLRKHQTDEVFLNFSLGSLIGCAYYWNYFDFLNRVIFNKQIGWYWGNEKLIFLVLTNSEIDGDDFIKLLLTLHCSTYKYLKDKKDIYKRFLKIVVMETYNKSVMNMNDLVLLNQIELKQIKAFTNFKIKEEYRRLFMPNVFESTILKKNCKYIHDKVKHKIK